MFIISLMVLSFFPMVLFVADQVVEFMQENSKEARRIQAENDTFYAEKLKRKLNRSFK